MSCVPFVPQPLNATREPAEARVSDLFFLELVVKLSLGKSRKISA